METRLASFAKVSFQNALARDLMEADLWSRFSEGADYGRARQAHPERGLTGERPRDEEEEWI